MPRKTDTYAKVLELAATWTAEGRALEQTAMRKHIGYGSYSTINRALQAWRAHHAPETANPGPPSAAKPGNTPAPGMLDSLAQIQQTLVALASAASPGASDPKVASELSARLDAIAQRFDGAQRHMLLQIEEARTHAAKWRDKWEASQREVKAWRDAVQAAQSSAARLREELAWLRGSAGQAPLPAPTEATPQVLSAQQPPGAGVSRYPGHPRPVPQHVSDDDFE